MVPVVPVDAVPPAVPDGWMTCVSGAELLGVFDPSPPKLALTLCVPGVSVDVVSVATPAIRGWVANVAAPSRKVTVPVGLDPVTVAVNVTACPAVDGFADEVSVVVVCALLTVTEAAGSVQLVAIAALPVSPE